MGQALRARFGAALDVVAVDRVAAPGIVVADLTRELPSVGGRFELVVAAHLLNELHVDAAPEARIAARARRVVAWGRALLADGGTMILVEPALRETSRALLGVRDRLAGSGLYIVAPCFWAGPCPAPARDRDWCHDAASVGSAPRVDFSYLVLRARPGAPAATTVFRVVSDLLVEKGRLRIFGCGPAGRHALVRLDRAASPANAAFETLARGDVVTVEGTSVAPDGLRVTEQTSVSPARRPIGLKPAR